MAPDDFIEPEVGGMRDDEQSPDDTSTRSYRKEKGDNAASGAREPLRPAPNVGASIRGPVGSEAAPDESSASSGSDADRVAAEGRDEQQAETD